MATLFGIIIFSAAWFLLAAGLRTTGAGPTRRHTMGVLLGILVAIMYAAVVSAWRGNAHAHEIAEAQAQAVVTASRLLALDYAESQAKADSRFKGRYVKVGGMVIAVEGDVVRLDGARGKDVFATLANADEAAQLRSGEATALLCKGDGARNGQPVLQDCRIV